MGRTHISVLTGHTSESLSPFLCDDISHRHREYNQEEHANTNTDIPTSVATCEYSANYYIMPPECKPRVRFKFIYNIIKATEKNILKQISDNHGVSTL